MLMFLFSDAWMLASQQGSTRLCCRVYVHVMASIFEELFIVHESLYAIGYIASCPKQQHDSQEHKRTRQKLEKKSSCRMKGSQRYAMATSFGIERRRQRQSCRHFTFCYVRFLFSLFSRSDQRFTASSPPSPVIIVPIAEAQDVPSALTKKKRRVVDEDEPRNNSTGSMLLEVGLPENKS